MKCLCHEWCDDVTLSKHKHLRHFILAIKVRIGSKSKVCVVLFTLPKKKPNQLRKKVTLKKNRKIFYLYVSCFFVLFFCSADFHGK